LLKLIIIVFLFILSLNANDISTIMSNIKNAKPSEKRVLINKLKIMLRNSNSQIRNKMISKIQKTHGKQKHKMQNRKMLHGTNKKIQDHIPNNMNFIKNKNQKNQK